MWRLDHHKACRNESGVVQDKREQSRAVRVGAAKSIIQSGAILALPSGLVGESQLDYENSEP